MQKGILLIFFFFLCLTLANAQVGGSRIYEFLNFSASARITALGGKHIAVKDDDLSFAVANPGVLNKSMHQQLSFNHNFLPANIKQGYAGYAFHSDTLNTSFHLGVQYVGYGDFKATDEFGNITGTFEASEYAITFGAAKSLFERLSIGANLKIITSRFESYNSFGLVTDFSAVYHIDDKGFTGTLLFRNAGAQLKTYRDGNREKVPFELLIGISKKLKYLPFRFSITSQHLERWNLLYDNPNSEENSFFLGETTVSSNEWIDNFFRHFIFSGEFLFGKKENFRLRFAYNHFRKKDLSVRNIRSLAGFSGGFGFKIKRFRFSYGIGIYHLGGSTNHLSISTNLKEFSRSKR